MGVKIRLTAALIFFSLANVMIAQTPSVRVGVWNIEALSKSAKRGFPELQGSAALGPRTDQDLKRIAEYLKNDIKVDALMITEIEADAATSTVDRPQSEQLDKICGHLGSNWRYFLGRTGGKMRLGLLFNEDRIQLKKLVNLHADPFFVSGKDVYDRDPFIVWINVRDGGAAKNDMLLACLHLKSQQKPFRHNRMAAVAKLLGDLTDAKVRRALTLPSAGEEPQVLILGDCNQEPPGPTEFKYMFGYLDGLGFAHLRPASGDYPRTRINKSRIDHIFASKGARDAMVPDSFRVHNVQNTQAANAAYRKVFSDHFPVTVDVKIQADNDESLQQVLAMNDAQRRGEMLASRTEELQEFIPDETLPDDEDTEPITVQAEIIDGDFERVLAPRAATPQPSNSAAAPPSGGTRAEALTQPLPQEDSRDVATFARPKATGLLGESTAASWAAEEAPSQFSTRRKAPNLKVFVLEGETLPEDLRAAVAPQFEQYIADAEHAKQLILSGRDGATIRNAVDSNEVAAVEISRPVTIGPAIPLVPFNREARMTHLVNQLLATHSDSHQHGAQIRSAIFDGGKIRASHREFAGDDGNSRVDVHSTTTPQLSDHATHVCGTMSARGVDDRARGMAKQLRVTSFDFNNDLNVLELVANQFRVSNHSYGPISGWNFNPRFGWEWWGDTSLSDQEDVKFGKYGIDNRQFDDILHRNPELLAVVAAGNDRNDEPRNQPILHWAIARNPATGALGWVQSSLTRRGDGADRGGLDTIAGLGVSKNCLCIGAIHDITNSGHPILTTDFSSWGPVDDGRIKPDLSANGQDLLSTSSASDSSYLEMPGTSMASPTAAGIAAVLMEVFESVHGRFPSSAEIKAVLIHTATDDSTHPGPDPIYGWGSINALAAGDLLKASEGVFIVTDDLATGDSREWKFSPPSGAARPVRATLVWNDPPAAPNSAGLDDATPALVNDLDLEVEAPGNATPLHPYSLNRGDPLSPATTSAANRVDNVEVVDAPSASGEWRVRVKPHSISSGSLQRFTLIVSGLSPVQSDSDTTSRPTRREP